MVRTLGVTVERLARPVVYKPLTAAAHIAGGIELSEAVAATRAAADRARAMGDASPLPMVLVDPGGAVRQLNEAAMHKVAERTVSELAASIAEKLIRAIG